MRATPFGLTHEKVFEKIAVAMSSTVSSSTTADATDGTETAKQMAWLSGARWPAFFFGMVVPLGRFSTIGAALATSSPSYREGSGDRASI